MFWHFIPFLPFRRKKKKTSVGKVFLILTAVCAGISAVAYASIKLYRKFCVIDNVDKDAIDDDDFLTEDSDTSSSEEEGTNAEASSET
ncbi:MAG: hypothetical protein IJU20_01190 [Clostridia bacterium]|nr:hypothetical protein [Clostridia bacterium]